MHTLGTTFNTESSTGVGSRYEKINDTFVRSLSLRRLCDNRIYHPLSWVRETMGDPVMPDCCTAVDIKTKMKSNSGRLEHGAKTHRVEKHVRWLKVSVQHRSRVDVLERAQDLV